MTRTIAAFRRADSSAGGIAAGTAGEHDVSPRPTTQIRSIGRRGSGLRRGGLRRPDRLAVLSEVVNVPLFMDRHDIPGITPEEVAQAHLVDLAVAPKHNVQFLTYWFDAQAGAAFCLARADQPSDMAAVHAESHGLVPNVIIPVVEDNVLKFLGKIEDPGGAPAASGFRTILFTDLEGSTALLNDLGQSEFMLLLTEHDLIIRRALVVARGREVKHTGDGFMAAFDDVGRALACAIAIQDGFDERNASVEGTALGVRIGLAAGEPVDRGDDLFGATVNLASRICGAADAGQILVSDDVRDLGAEAGYRFRDVGSRTLKGFAEPTPLYELLRDHAG